MCCAYKMTTKKEPAPRCGKRFQSVKEEQIMNTTSEIGMVRLNLAMMSTVFPLHMRFDDISEINAANSTR